MKLPTEIKDSKKHLNNQNQNDDKQSLQKIKDVALEIIDDTLDYFNKINIKLEKSEKYSLKQWSLNSPIDVVLNLKKFVSEITSGFKNYINNVNNINSQLVEDNFNQFKNPNSQNVIEEEDYYKLEKEQQKYEQKVRDQIRIEQQQKLHTESLQTKLDENIKDCEYDKTKIQKKVEGLQSDLLREKDQNMLLNSENFNLVNEYRDNNLRKDQEFFSDQKESHNGSHLKVEENSIIYANSFLLPQSINAVSEPIILKTTESRENLKISEQQDINAQDLDSPKDTEILQSDLNENMATLEIYSDSNEVRESQDVNLVNLQKNLSLMPKVDIQQENSLPDENSFKVNMQNKKLQNSIKQVIPNNKSVISGKNKEKSQIYQKSKQNEIKKGTMSQTNVNKSVPKNIGASLNYNLLQNNEKRGISMSNQLQNSKQKIISSTYKSNISKTLSSNNTNQNNDTYNSKLQKIFIKANFSKNTLQENQNTQDDYNFSNKKKKPQNKPTTCVKKSNIVNNNFSNNSQIFDEAQQNVTKNTTEPTKLLYQKTSQKKSNEMKESNSLRNSCVKKEVQSNSMIKKREETQRIAKSNNFNPNNTTTKKEKLISDPGVIDKEKVTNTVPQNSQSNAKLNTVQKYFNQYSSNSNLTSNTKAGQKYNNVIGCLSSNTANTYKSSVNQNPKVDAKKTVGVKQYQALSKVRSTYSGTQANLQKNFVAGENIGNLQELAVLQSYSGSVGSNTKEKMLIRPSTNYTKKTTIKNNNRTSSFDNS